MASHRRAKARPGSAGRTLALTVAAAAAALTGGGSALAAPGAPGPGAGGDPAQRLQALYEQAEQAGQRYDGVQEQTGQAQHRAAEVQQRIAVEQQQLNGAVDELGALAGAQYRDGSLPPELQLMFDSRPEDYLRRADALDRADARTTDRVHAIQEQQQRLDRDRAMAEHRLAELQRLRGQLAAAKSEIQHRMGAARALLASLTAGRRSAVQQAVNGTGDGLGDAAAQAADAALAVAGSRGADGRSAAAVAAVRTALGRPYVYGSTGPGAFDCSGLMYWAWRHAGVTLPRTSQGQSAAGQHVPLAQARPGDLVIYYGDRHHVGMYMGNGMVVHAPHSGATVRYDRVNAMPVESVVRV
jgi:cell wall-associated NlpC family hydrolase